MFSLRIELAVPPQWFQKAGKQNTEFVILARTHVPLYMHMLDSLWDISMLSRLLKAPVKESKKKGSKDDSKDASLHDQFNRVRQEDLASVHTPRTPRLERARNQRWHLVEFDIFDELPRRSLSNFTVTSSDTSHHEPSSPTLLDPHCPSSINKKGDKRNCAQQALPILESSPENTPSSDVHRPSQPRQQRTSDESDDVDGLSSEFSTCSGSPSRLPETVGVDLEGISLGADPASSFTQRPKKKVTTQKRLHATNGSDKIKTVSISPPAQERVDVVGHSSPLPDSIPLPVPLHTKPAYTKSSLKNDTTSFLVCPRTADWARQSPTGNGGALPNLSGPLLVQKKRDISPHQGPRRPQHNLSGPLWVQGKRDSSPYQGHPKPAVSPHTSGLPSNIPKGSKGVRNFLSGPLHVQGKKRDPSPHFKSPLQSPGRSPLTSPKLTSAIPVSPHGDVQTAHPLPLPWSSNTSSASPRSNTSSAERSEESCRVDPPLVSTRWPCSPGGGDTASSCGKWLKGTLLGSGSFGKVYRGHHSETGDMCAIKEVEIVADDPRSKECAKQLAQEIALLSMLRHPNILHYKGSEMVGENLYIYLELVSGGSIYRLLQEFKSFAEPVIRRYTRQILLGLEFLHAKNTVHRDIKCANILVDQDGRVKLADFGMAKLVGNETSPLSFKGSPYWMAPEVILRNNTGHECAIDIWSLGCTVIEMASGKPPWFQYDGYAAIFKVMNCNEVPIPSSLSPVGQNFVSLCLQRDPAKRPSAAALLEHPFVQVDKGPSLLVQTVSDTLCQDLIRKGKPPPRMTSRVPDIVPSNGGISSRSPHNARIPTSRSAVQLSEYGNQSPAREVRRSAGQATNTEDNSIKYEGSRMNNGGVPNKRLDDIYKPHAVGLEPSTWRYTSRNYV